jgi:hypothetical protein
MEVTTMKRIIYVGTDVHLTSYTVYCVQFELFVEDKIFGHMKLEPTVASVKRYLAKMSVQLEKAGG